MSKMVLDNLAKRGINRATWIEAGFSGQKYDDVNRGRSSLKLDDVVRISEKFQLSLDYLITGLEKNPNSTILNDNERELLELFRALPEREQLKQIIRLEDVVKGNEAWASVFRSLQGRQIGVPAAVDNHLK